MKKKNMIWFFVDQLRRDAVSINGDENIVTPAIDNLAKQGVNFTQAVGGVPLCCPCRSSILSGRYPQHTGVAGHEMQLHRELPLVSDYFNEQGYETAYFGKWHLEGLRENQHKGLIPKEGRGRFKTFIGYENNNSPFDVWVHGHRGEEEISAYRLPAYETVSLTELAIEQIRQYGINQSKSTKEKETKPFFLVLSVQPPHDPYIAPPENLSHFQPQQLTLKGNVPDYEKLRTEVGKDLAGYYGAITTIDQQLSRLQTALEEEGLAEETHILFFSDHGDMHGSHGMYRKTNPYEESVGVPFIIGGGKPLFYEGYRSGKAEVPFNHVDIVPTTLGLCDLPIPEELPGTDYSYLRLASRTEMQAADSVFIQSIIPTMHGDSIDKPWRGVITAEGYKYVCFERQEWLFFDLNADPLELINQAHNSDYIGLRRSLRQRLARWIEETGDRFELPEV